MTNFCSDPQSEEFRSDPKFAANTRSPTGVVVASDNPTKSYYFRRRFGFANNLESLPGDLLSDILARLPAHGIRDSVGLVCPKWYHLTRTTDFIHAHFQRATSGLLLYSLVFPRELIFISMKEGRVEKFTSRKEYGYDVWSSCNGLVFGSSWNNKSKLCILNPATKQHYDLPPFCDKSYVEFYSCLAYVAASKEYKVVLCHNVRGIGGVPAKAFTILTVGVDSSWRHVRTQHFSETSRTLLFNDTPLTTGGFVHWVTNMSANVLTMNVETETISESRVPLSRDHRGKRKFYLSTGRYLTVLVALGNFSWDVWQMESETGEWLKGVGIDLEDEKWKFDRFLQDREENLVIDEGMLFVPVGWLDYPEVLVFHPPPRNHSCIVYKVRTREIDSFELPTFGGYYIFRFHKNSLLSVG
ncbi:Unknown protein [Striga hermonthica]|uniref:F-box domain-containing protein n=1 Tax=Striga hermonthica TaxID=68872 RepID=A0A9N7MUR7_STRHE|nr:Unknown protein [Striga hermonthica]